MQAILRILKQWYEATKGSVELSRQLGIARTRLKLCKGEKGKLAQALVESGVELERAADKIREIEDKAQDLQLQLHPTPPSYVEVVPYAESYASLREIFPIQLIYGFDDVDNEVSLLTDVLQALVRMKVYEYLYEPERRDCENFSKGIKGRFALAPGWTGFLVLNLEFRLPPDPLFGIRSHSEVLFYAIENREGYTRAKKWYVFEGQSKDVFEVATEMFEDDTGREAYLMK